MPLLDHFIVHSATEAFLYMVFGVMEWDLSMKSVSRLLRQLVQGVAHLHVVDIVHCDLSMANMLIRKE